MKILFVNPYIYDFTAYDLWLRPLGLLYIASVVKKYTDGEVFWIDTLDRFQDSTGEKSKEDGRGKFSREIVKKTGIYKKVPRNYSRYGIPYENFLQKIDRIPDVDMILITSLMTFWIDGLTVTIKALRNRFHRAKIVLGGVLPTLVHEKILKKMVDADIFLKGYGEEKILDLIRDNHGKVYEHPDFSEIDNIPFPAFELLSNKKVLPVLTSRGCPYRCSYCASYILNPGFLERKADSILEEIHSSHEKYGTENFIIFDDALLVNKNSRFFNVFTRLKKNINAKFHTPNGLHAREIDEKTAGLLFESGFRTTILSFESIKPEILSKSSHKVNIENMINAVDNLEKAGFSRNEIEVYLLFGYPGQSLKDIEEALMFVRDLGVVPHLSYFSPVPGTDDFFSLQKAGILSKDLNLYEGNKIFFVYSKSGLSEDEIQHAKELTANITRSLRNQH